MQNRILILQYGVRVVSQASEGKLTKKQNQGVFLLVLLLLPAALLYPSEARSTDFHRSECESDYCGPPSSSPTRV